MVVLCQYSKYIFFYSKMDASTQVLSYHQLNKAYANTQAGPGVPTIVRKRIKQQRVIVGRPCTITTKRKHPRLINMQYKSATTSHIIPVDIMVSTREQGTDPMEAIKETPGLIEHLVKPIQGLQEARHPQLPIFPTKTQIVRLMEIHSRNAWIINVINKRSTPQRKFEELFGDDSEPEKLKGDIDMNNNC